MKIQAFYPNLPVADLPKSVAFFEALGFPVIPAYSNETAAAISLGDSAAVMLLTHPFFKDHAPRPIADARATTQVILGIQLPKREDVDSVADAAIAAGATVTSTPADHGFMYSRPFTDLDGHAWEAFWMNPGAQPHTAS